MRSLREVHNAKKQGFLLAETDQDMAIWLKDARLRRMLEELHAMAEEQGRAGMSDGVRDAMSLIVNILDAAKRTPIRSLGAILASFGKTTRSIPAMFAKSAATKWTLATCAAGRAGGEAMSWVDKPFAPAKSLCLS